MLPRVSNEPTPIDSPVSHSSSRPDQNGGNGPEEAIGQRGAALTDRLRAATFLLRAEDTERQRWGRLRTFPGKVLGRRKRGPHGLRRGGEGKEGQSGRAGPDWTMGRWRRRRCGGRRPAPLRPGREPERGATYHPIHQAASGAGRQYHLGSNKWVYDAVFAP